MIKPNPVQARDGKPQEGDWRTNAKLKSEIPVETKKVNPEPLAFLAFLCVIVGLGLGFLKAEKGTAGSAIAGGLGFLLLLALKSKLDDDALRQGQGMIQVSYELGFYLASILLFLGAGINAYFFLQGKAINLPQPGGSQGYGGLP